MPASRPVSRRRQPPPSCGPRPRNGPRSSRRPASSSNNQEISMIRQNSPRQWPAEGLTRVPYWVYSDRDLYQDEMAHIFRGRTWHFLCLEAELPRPNTFRTSHVGDMSVVVTRDQDGHIRAFENRCAHRGSLICLNERGE